MAQGQPIGTSKLLALVVFIIASFAAGWLGSIAISASLPTWYADLAKPSFTVPDWLIPIVWSILYVLMGIGAWLVWLQPGSVARNSALLAFFVQLALNAGWSWVFFGMRSPGLGLMVILIQFAAIAWLVLASLSVRRAAAVLFLPYLVWTGYAAALNAVIFLLN